MVENTRRQALGLIGIGIGLDTGAVPGSALAAAPRARPLAGVAPIVELRPEPTSPPLKEGTFVSGTAELWYWDAGGKEPVVILLHPATGSGRVWGYQQQAFVNAGIRAIGYSRRGAAGSTNGEPGDRTSTTDDLLALINHLGLSRVHLVATAGGAFTAVDFAHSHSDRVRSAVLANSLLGVTGPEIDPMLAAIQLGSLSKLPVELRELSPAYRVANPAGTAKWIEYTHGGTDGAVPKDGPGPGAPGFGLGPDGANAGPGAGGKPAGTLPDAGLRRTLDDLRGIRRPVLLLAGDADLLAPPPLVEVFTRYFPDSRMVRLPACGHSGYWEVPEQFNAAVISFVRASDRRA